MEAKEKEELRKRLAALEQAKMNAYAGLHQILGQIALLEDLLKDDKPKVSGRSLQPVDNKTPKEKRSEEKG